MSFLLENVTGGSGIGDKSGAVFVPGGATLGMPGLTGTGYYVAVLITIIATMHGFVYRCHVFV